jgi:hypothetical protein
MRRGGCVGGLGLEAWKADEGLQEYSERGQDER